MEMETLNEDQEEQEEKEEQIVTCEIVLEVEQTTPPKKKRRAPKIWVHESNKERDKLGEFHLLYPDLKMNPSKYFQHYRLNHDNFQDLLNLLHLRKETTRFRRPIQPEERLAVCLRYLATGCSFRLLASSFRMGEKTVRKIVYDTCAEIWNKMKPKPPTNQEWSEIANIFWEKWNFPNCIGALDGRHVVIESRRKEFYIAVFAVVDADSKFKIVDIRGLGRNTNGYTLKHSILGKSLMRDKLHIPADTCLPGTEEQMPHVIVTDESFLLQRCVMRPYPESQAVNNEEKKTFNYHLRRARCVSENAFGMLARRFRIYKRQLSLSPEHVGIIIAATIALHNFLINSETHWSDSDLRNTPNRGLLDLPKVGGNASQAVLEIREKFKKFLFPNASYVTDQANVAKEELEYYDM